MSITAADIELVTQVLEDDPVPEHLQRQTAVVERLGMEIDSTRERLEAICRQLEQLTERMSREESLLVLLCQRTCREKAQRHRTPRRSSAADGA